MSTFEVIVNLYSKKNYFRLNKKGFWGNNYFCFYGNSKIESDFFMSEFELYEKQKCDLFHIK